MNRTHPFRFAFLIVMMVLACNVHAQTAPLQSNSSTVDARYRGSVMDSTYEEMSRLLHNMVDSLTLWCKHHDVEMKKENKKFDRSHFNFLWSFTNWGDAPYNGLSKLDGAYNLRTSFSSYQLEMSYDVARSRHWSLGVGLGYESDVYKFNNNYVALIGGTPSNLQVLSSGSISAIEGTRAEFDVSSMWRTKLTVRYVQLPIRVAYHSADDNFSIGLSLVGGLSYNGKHTGFKHILERKGTNYMSKDSEMNSHINSYKIDVRMDMSVHGVTLFLQLPTQPLLIDMDQKVYPIKLGIVF